MNRPLRIVDLSTNPMGGYATRLLAAYGAEVVKVEPPRTGEPTRAIGPFPDDQPHPDRGGASLFLDANKKSVTLDIARQRGREILDRLLQTADVMVETFAPAQADQLGLNYSELERRFPHLIVTSITPFGKDGPYRDFHACDIVIEAMSGWLFQSGESECAPTRTRGEMATAVIPGLFAACGTLAALAWRAQTSEGQLVEVAAMEAMIAASRYYSTSYAYSGVLIKRLGTTLSATYCYRPARDGWAALCATTDQQRKILAHVTGLSDYLDDPAFAPPAAGQTNADTAAATLINQWVAERTRGEIFHLLQEMRVPSGYLTTAEEVLALEQLRAREAFVTINHPEVGSLEFPGAPFKMEAPRFQNGRAPLLGEHNEQVFAHGLGISSETLAALRAEEII